MSIRTLLLAGAISGALSLSSVAYAQSATPKVTGWGPIPTPPPIHVDPSGGFNLQDFNKSLNSFLDELNNYFTHIHIPHPPHLHHIHIGPPGGSVRP